MSNLTLTPEEKHQLLSVLRELDHDAPPEQRQNPRRKVHLSATIRMAEPHNIPINSIIVNVSVQGVGIILSKPLAKSAKFILPLRFSEGGGWLVLCEVRNCVSVLQVIPNQYQRQWKVGARFLERIDDPKATAMPPLDWLV